MRTKVQHVEIMAVAKLYSLWQSGDARGHIIVQKATDKNMAPA